MNPLSKLLNQQIRYNGPMSISQFMEICLLHPKYGYYTNSSPFGQKGDFVTAPEVSQMFGELIGLFLAQAWSDQKNLEEAVLVELGPGRGTLTADIMSDKID
jgi:NADH dehydrogenase [ubiquinone] 1 alpha subcomplex assembly factor 7